MRSVTRRAYQVLEVTAHGARGIHATIATQMGTTSHVVAMALGHGSAEVTRRHYIRPGTAEQASRARENGASLSPVSLVWLVAELV